MNILDILRKFNPKLKGFSTGYGSVDEENTGFNVAIPGSVVGYVYITKQEKCIFWSFCFVSNTLSGNGIANLRCVNK